MKLASKRFFGSLLVLTLAAAASEISAPPASASDTLNLPAHQPSLPLGVLALTPKGDPILDPEQESDTTFPDRAAVYVGASIIRHQHLGLNAEVDATYYTVNGLFNSYLPDGRCVQTYHDKNSIIESGNKYAGRAVEELSKAAEQFKQQPSLVTTHTWQPITADCQLSQLEPVSRPAATSFKINRAYRNLFT